MHPFFLIKCGPYLPIRRLGTSLLHCTLRLHPTTPYTLHPIPYTLYPVQVGYLIVQENWVPEGMSHRKGGVRTDYPDIGDSRMVGYCRLQWYVPQQYRMESRSSAVWDGVPFISSIG